MNSLFTEGLEDKNKPEGLPKSTQVTQELFQHRYSQVSEAPLFCFKASSFSRFSEWDKEPKSPVHFSTCSNSFIAVIMILFNIIILK